MSKATGIPENLIMFFILGLFVSLIEIGMFITSPHYAKADDEDSPPTPPKEEKKTRKRYTRDEIEKMYPIENFIDALFSEEGKPQKNSVNALEQKLGYSIKVVIYYKNRLLAIRKNGQALLKDGPGYGIVPSFSKEEILDAVKGSSN